MTDCRLCPAGTVALHLASALVAEADGNRTRQRRGTPLSGFEDRCQLPTTVQFVCSALSFAQVIQDLAGSAGTGRDRSCTARVFPSRSHLRADVGIARNGAGARAMSAQEEPARASTVHVGFLRTETSRSPGFTPSSGGPTSPRPVGQSGLASCWRYTVHRAARPCLAVLGQLAEAERAERVRGLRVRRSYRTDCRAGSSNHRKGQVPDDGLSATNGEGLELPRQATVGLVQDERLQLRACRNRVRAPALMLRATAA